MNSTYQADVASIGAGVADQTTQKIMQKRNLITKITKD